ncbi:MAG: hypothetical protein EXS05_04755 [Planctomycetaceae bacterium]|nr:hypothetical protein [Planctomycetaceae bacterium]
MLVTLRSRHRWLSVRRMRISLAATAWLLVIASLGRTEDGLSLTWSKPAAPPEFRESVTGADFDGRLKKALDDLGDLEALKKSKRPVFGVLINEVTAGSQAAAAGVRAGDILTRVNRDEVRGGLPPFRDTRRQIQWYAVQSDRIRTAAVQPGRLGISASPYWRPELGYLRGTSRNAKWDREVLAGLTMCETDPALAESAWRRALKAGYPRDLLADQCGAAMALAQGRPEIAADFGAPALEASGDAAAVLQPLILFRVALANGKLPAAIELDRKFPEQLADQSESLTKLLEQYSALPAERRAAAVPGDAAATRHHDDLLPRCVGHGDNSIKYYLPLLHERNGLAQDVPDEHQTDIVCEPEVAARDVSLTVRFRAETKGDSEPLCARMFEVSLLNRDAPKHEYGDGFRTDQVLAARIYEKSRVSLIFGDPSTRTVYHDQRCRFDGTQSVEIRLLRVGSLGELYINAQRVLRIPVDDDVDSLMASIHVSGVKMVVESFEFDELIENAAGDGK